MATMKNSVSIGHFNFPPSFHRPELGTLVPVRNPEALGSALADALALEYEPATVAALGEGGFIVSERNGWIRVAPHATTPMRVIDAFGDALADQVRNA